MIEERVKKFINENADLIEDNKWEDVYYGIAKYLSLEERVKFIEMMLSAEINPFYYMDKIPAQSLYGSIIERITIPSNIETIGFEAFSDCTKLESVTIESGVTIIRSLAFFGCSSLPSITIPNSVTGIGDDAFELCTNLTDVNIGSGVTTIGANAFARCSRLTSIEYKGTVEQWQAISKGSFWRSNVPESCIVHCIDGDLKLW